MVMDTIMVLSPGYIDSVMSCLGRYKNFCIAGYSDILSGIRALKKIPGSNILGFSYLNDNIRIDDVNNLRVLLNKINIVFQNKYKSKGSIIKIPFIFLLSTKLGGYSASVDYVKSIINDLNLDKLEIGYYNYEVVTDTLIKMQMFGSILLKKRSFEIKESEIKDTFNNADCLSIKFPFEKKFIELFDPLTFIETDKFFEKYKSDKLITLIRLYLYNPSRAYMEQISDIINTLPFEDRIPYDSCLRNLDLTRRFMK